MERAAAAQKWYQIWSKQPATRTAIESLKAISSKTNTDFDITSRRILLACFNAKHYKRKLDPGEEYRQKICEEKNRLKSTGQSCAHIETQRATE